MKYVGEGIAVVTPNLRTTATYSWFQTVMVKKIFESPQSGRTCIVNSVKSWPDGKKFRLEVQLSAASCVNSPSYHQSRYYIPSRSDGPTSIATACLTSYELDVLLCTNMHSTRVRRPEYRKFLMT